MYQILRSALQLLCYALTAATLVMDANATEVTLTAFPTPARFGAPVTLAASVPDGATGNVAFYDGPTLLGTGVITGRQATFTTTSLPSGARFFRAQYEGDTGHAAAASPTLTQTIMPDASLGLLPAVSYSTGAETFPNSIAVMDFNGDGKLDIAVSDGSSGTVSVFLNNGSGTFGPPTIYEIGVDLVSCDVLPCSTVGGIVAGDFNRDGRIDLVVTASFKPTIVNGALASGGLAVLLGKGDGRFSPAKSYASPNYGISLVAADFNGDGKIDVAGATGDGVIVALGNGNGTFQEPVYYSAGGSPFGGNPNTRSQSVGDVNGDGKLDLVLVNRSSGTISVLLGNGEGTFQAAIQMDLIIPPPTQPSIASPACAVVGDFNGDGVPDLAVSGTEGTAITVLLGKGGGIFGPPVSYIVGTSGDGLAVGDLNGDGKLDLVVSDGNRIGVLLGNGDGTFLPPIFSNVPGPLNAVAIADFNGDGKADVAVANSDSSVEVLLGGATSGLSIEQTHTGSFVAGGAVVYSLTVSNTGAGETWGTVRMVDALPPGFRATNMVGDGWNCDWRSATCSRSDILAPGAQYPPVYLSGLLANGISGAVINKATVYPSGDTSSSGSSASNTEQVLGASTTTLAITPNPAVLGQPVTMTATVTPPISGTVAFYNGATLLGTKLLTNGQAAMATAMLPSGKLRLSAQFNGSAAYGPSGTTVALTVSAVAANGYQPPKVSSLDPNTGAAYFAVSDFNRDGKLDVVTANYWTHDVSVQLGKGDGTFGPPVRAAGLIPAPGPGGLGLYQVEAGDFNGDGIPDIAVVGDNGFWVLLGNGDGTFQPALPFHASGLAQPKLLLADFNHDGSLDVFLYVGAGATVFLGKGDGTFREPLTLHGDYSLLGPVVDMNGDGIPDLIFGRGTDTVIGIGRGDGNFIMGRTSLGCGDEALSAGDFNGDGKTDVIALGMARTVCLGDGHGGLGPPIVSKLDEGFAFDFAVADFNGDGNLDYATYWVNALGNGNGTFGASTRLSFPGHGLGKPVVGDFNGDGRPDIAVLSVPDDKPSAVYVLLGQFSGLAVASSHTGVFAAGQKGATYQITVTNPSASAGSGLVTVTDNLPAGLTATSISGPGWACSLSTLACTRSDALASNASYPPITLTVNVSTGVGAESVTNSVSVQSATLSATSTDLTALSALSISALVNAATRRAGPVAPNTLVFALGSFPHCYSGAQVLLAGSAVSVIYTSPAEILFAVPGSVAIGANSSVVISCAGLSSQAKTLPIVTAAPAIFTLAANGIGQAASINPDGGFAMPAQVGSELTIFGTGFGAYGLPGTDGLAGLANTVTASIGGIVATVTYAGAAPGSTPAVQMFRLQVPTLIDVVNRQEALQLMIAPQAATQGGVTVSVRP